MNEPAAMLPDQAREVLDFWFGASPEDAADAARNRVWFGADAALDAQIAVRFGGLVEAALAGGLRDWEQHPRGRLALVILLDQFTRNMFRGQSRAFAGDARAKALAQATLEAPLTAIERVFLGLPFEHAESIADQDIAVGHFAALSRSAPVQEQARYRDFLEFAERHREVILRFGRFPHRNAVLGRPMTAQETQWLAQGGSRFGQ